MSKFLRQLCDQLDPPEPYGWIIDKDHLYEPGESHQDAVGTMGPHDIRSEIETRLRNGEGRRFRLYDGDGERHYDGRIITPTDEEGGTELDFGPLDDFGKGASGATEIHYYNADKKAWEEL